MASKDKSKSKATAKQSTIKGSSQSTKASARGKVPRTKSQYTLDSRRRQCTICDRIPRFNKRRFAYLVNYADRLNLVLFLFALAFVIAAWVSFAQKDHKQQYVYYFGFVAMLHLFSAPFGVLFTHYGRRCFLYANMIPNIVVVGGTFGYMTYYRSVKSRNEYLFASDKCMQTALGVYQSTAILQMIIQLVYCFKMDLFRARFNLKLWQTADDAGPKGLGKVDNGKMASKVSAAKQGSAITKK